MKARVAVLVSIGRHPQSGRPRLADLDARALELALNLVDSEQIDLVHAGAANLDVLSGYVGMGLKQVTVLRPPPGADIVPGLVQYLKDNRPAVTLAGCSAESGEGSGQVPYILANALQLPLLPALASLLVRDQRAIALQALPRGQRRQLEAPIPLIATVDRSAPSPRQSAFRLARDAQTAEIHVPGVADVSEVRRVPARAKPKRISIPTGGNAADRLRALTQIQTKSGELLVNPAPGEAAEAIWNYLLRERIISPGVPPK
jgi:electron transfer flavoprotein beta subunit